MNKIYRNMLVAFACASTLSLTSCIEETIPTSGATAEQLASSSKATEALLWAQPAILNKLGTYSSDYAYDWGYGSLMHMRDVMTADQAVVASGYNWYSAWSSNTSLGDRYVASYFAWTYFWKAIQTTNNLIAVVDSTSASDAQKGYLGAAYAYRALFYLDAARSYEFLPNDASNNVTEEGNDITNLTIPIVTEKTTEADARNNPRRTRQEMADFILNDLKDAEKLIPYLEEETKTLPHLSTVYGLMARTYMWVEKYDSAAICARAAIALGDNEPMDETEWLDVNSGFNTVVDSWMLASQQSEDDDVVRTGILNWTSWMSNETNYGYAAAEPYVMIASDLYNKISNDDFRKLAFKAPKTNPLSGTEPVLNKDVFDGLPDYASLKFRPGSGNVDDYKVGSSTAYPLMRIEEMYFIEAEATAHLDAAAGKSLIESFMNTYRYKGYTCKATSPEGVVEEIVTQKRIEFFGEGITFFDYKRLNMSVDRTLSKNWDDSERFKTNGRPAWMNLTIPYAELSNNKALDGYQNPDPSDLYKAILSE